MVSAIIITCALISVYCIVKLKAMKVERQVDDKLTDVHQRMKANEQTLVKYAESMRAIQQAFEGLQSRVDKLEQPTIRELQKRKKWK